jgi:hypothetical protein
MENNSLKGLLFEQLPNELNSILLNLIEAEDLLKLSRTCKRWLNNTKFITDLKFRITHKPTRVPGKSNRPSKTRTFVLAKLNTRAISLALSRFTPEILQTLALSPDLLQASPNVDDFITRCTSLRSLKCESSNYLRDAISSLTQLKHLCLESAPNDGGEFAVLLKKLVNLQSLEFRVPHATWKEIRIDEFYSDLRHLKSLTLHNCANLYMKYEYIGKMVQLTKLEMPRAYITDDEFKFLSGLTNLEVLSLRNLQRIIPEDEITMEDSDEGELVVGNPDPLNGLRHLTNLKTLTYLDISNVQRDWHSEYDTATALDLAELQRHLINLKTINTAGTSLNSTDKDASRPKSGVKTGTKQMKAGSLFIDDTDLFS